MTFICEKSNFKMLIYNFNSMKNLKKKGVKSFIRKSAQKGIEPALIQNGSDPGVYISSFKAQTKKR